MIFDFPEKSILIRSVTTSWGPYLFNFWLCIPSPYDDPVTAVTVKSYLYTDGSAGVETTSILLSSSIMSTAPNIFEVYFDHPGPEFAGKHVLKFFVTLQSGKTNDFWFGFVDVE